MYMMSISAEQRGHALEFPAHPHPPPQQKNFFPTILEVL